MEILFNNKPISTWKLIALKGTLNALTAPAKAKAVQFNENAMIDGSRAVFVPRRVQKRNVAMSVLMQCSSLAELEEHKAMLEAELTANNEVEVSVPEIGYKYYFMYQDMDKYSNFDNAGKATVTLNFVELNPTRRTKL